MEGVFYEEIFQVWHLDAILIYASVNLKTSGNHTTVKILESDTYSF